MVDVIYSGYLREEFTKKVDFKVGTTGKEVVQRLAEMSEMDLDELISTHILIIDGQLLEESISINENHKLIRILPHSFCG